MFGKQNKISMGLLQLLEKGPSVHFRVSNDIFIQNPSFRSNYIELFNHAQVLEIAQGEGNIKA